MQVRPYSIWYTRAFLFLMGALAFTGMMQMPLAKRYYLTDVPGMAWTGDFYFVHKLHYVLAAMLLFVVALAAVNWLLEWKDKLQLTPLGLTRTIVLGGIIISGGFRVYRNMPGVTLDPAFVVTIEWVHLSLVMVMGVLALIAAIRKASAYVTLRQ